MFEKLYQFIGMKYYNLKDIPTLAIPKYPNPNSPYRPILLP